MKRSLLTSPRLVAVGCVSLEAEGLELWSLLSNLSLLACRGLQGQFSNKICIPGEMESRRKGYVTAFAEDEGLHLYVDVWSTDTYGPITYGNPIR